MTPAKSTRLIETFSCGHGCYSLHLHPNGCPVCGLGEWEEAWDEQPDGTFKRREFALR